MKLHTYSHITDVNGDPVSEWVTDEEFEKQEQEIAAIGDILKHYIHV